MIAATPIPMPTAAFESNFDVGSAPKLPAGANGAAWLILEHVPLEQTPSSAQSLFEEQALLRAVDVGVGVDVDVLADVDEPRMSVGNVSESIEAVAVGEGVAVSTSREKARRVLVEASRLVLVEASRLILVETACLVLVLVDIMIKECIEKNVGD
jgi:hypothetical protein